MSMVTLIGGTNHLKQVNVPEENLTSIPVVKTERGLPKTVRTSMEPECETYRLREIDLGYGRKGMFWISSDLRKEDVVYFLLQNYKAN